MLLNLIKRDNQCDFEELQGALQKLIALHKGADDKLVHERYNIFYAPDNRWGVPEDLAGPVVFLASKASVYVNGYTIAVDGGWLAR